jgi:hypothetical protein
MLKSVKGIYKQGQIELQEGVVIPPDAEILVTFWDTTLSNTGDSGDRVLNNKEIEDILRIYRQENRLRPIGLAKGEFVVPDDFNEPLPDEILGLFEG